MSQGNVRNSSFIHLELQVLVGSMSNEKEKVLQWDFMDPMGWKNITGSCNILKRQA